MACSEGLLTRLASDHTTEDASLLHFSLNPKVSKSQAFEGSFAECKEQVPGAKVRLLAPSPSSATHALRWGTALPDSVTLWVKVFLRVILTDSLRIKG